MPVLLDDLIWEKACELFETDEPTDLQLESAYDSLVSHKLDPYDEWVEENL